MCTRINFKKRHWRHEDKCWRKNSAQFTACFHWHSEEQSARSGDLFSRLIQCNVSEISALDHGVLLLTSSSLSLLNYLNLILQPDISNNTSPTRLSDLCTIPNPTILAWPTPLIFSHSRPWNTFSRRSLHLHRQAIAVTPSNGSIHPAPIAVTNPPSVSTASPPTVVCAAHHVHATHWYLDSAAVCETSWWVMVMFHYSTIFPFIEVRAGFAAVVLARFCRVRYSRRHVLDG